MDTPQERKKRRVVLTPNDSQLLRWLWLLRVLTLGQLRRLGYYQPETGRLSSLDNVRKRLKRLWDAGYLEGTRLAERKERVYVLGSRALEPLRERFGIRQWRLYRPRFDTEIQLHHALLVSECAVRFAESVRGTSFCLANLAPLNVPFVHTHLVGSPKERRHVDRFVSQVDLEVEGQAELLRIRPDLVFGIQKEGRGRLYFVEADRGTERPLEVATKLEAYAHYFGAPDPLDAERKLWNEYGDFDDFRVLIVTTTPRRVKSLAAAIKKSRGFDLASITTEDKLVTENPVFDGIWLNRSGSERALAKH